MREIIIDTSALLGCKDHQSLPWRALAEDGEVRVVVARRVVTELDEVKDSHSNPTMRHRARLVLRRLEDGFPGLSRETELAPGVLLVLDWEHPPEPMPAGLTTGRGDDEILAVALRRQTEADVVLMAIDTGARLGARATGVPAMAPPEEWLASVSDDPLERENESLRTRVSQLESRRPALRLSLADGDGVVTLESPGPLGEQGAFRVIAVNTGSVQATGALVELVFPRGIQVETEAIRYRREHRGNYLASLRLGSRPTDNVQDPDLIDASEGTRVTIEVANIPHHRPVELPPIWPCGAISGFSVEGRIHAAELPEPTPWQRLHVRIAGGDIE